MEISQVSVLIFSEGKTQRARARFHSLCVEAPCTFFGPWLSLGRALAAGQSSAAAEQPPSERRFSSASLLTAH